MATGDSLERPAIHNKHNRRLARVVILGLLSFPLLHAAPLPAQFQNAARALDAFGRVCDSEGRALWSKSLCGPMILVDRATRQSIANAPDPQNTFAQNGSFWIGSFPTQFTPSNTSIDWSGRQWATVMLPLPADPFLRIALLAHESFHRVQKDLGLNASDAANAHLDSETGRIWLRLELRALAQALRDTGPAGRRSAIDAMLFRAYRHQLLPGSAQAEESLERQEGLAEYTGVAIALRATGESINREARAIESFEDSSAYARSFAYQTGPALGLLLDRYDQGWHKQVRSSPMGELLASALHVTVGPDLAAQAKTRAALYGFAAVTAAEHEREERHQAFLARLQATFIDGPTLDFPTAPDLSRNFDPGTLVPFPPHGTFYPTGVFSAAWGKLEVDSEGALLAPDNRSVKVPAPLDPDARPIHGRGYTLTLSPGWTIQKGTKPGSFLVVHP